MLLRANRVTSPVQTLPFREPQFTDLFAKPLVSVKISLIFPLFPHELLAFLLQWSKQRMTVLLRPVGIPARFRLFVLQRPLHILMLTAYLFIYSFIHPLAFLLQWN